MIRCAVWYLAVTMVLVATLGVAPVTSAGPPGEVGPDGAAAVPGGSPGAILGHLTEGSAVRLGFGVAPLRSQLGLGTGPILGADASERGRNGDADARGTAVSFDLALTWPGAAGTGQVEPYVALGPALFVIEPDYAGRLLGTRVDPALQLGAKASAGVKWRLGKRTTLFGAYEVTAAPQGGFTAPGGKTPADTGLTGHDFTYGLRFLY
jgi:hypothetical protein